MNIGSKIIFDIEPTIIAFKEIFAAPCAITKFPRVTLIAPKIPPIINIPVYDLENSIIDGIAPMNFNILSKL